MSNDVWVYVEYDSKGLTDLTQQCLSCGRRLAHELGGRLCAVALGDDLAPVTSALAEEGINAVLQAEDDRLTPYTPSTHQRVLATALATHPPRILLLPASTQGDDLAAGLAEMAHVGCVLDCRAVDIDDEGLTGRRPEYDGKLLTAYTSAATTMVFTGADGVGGDGNPPPTATEPEVASLEVVLEETDLVTSVLKRDLAARTVDLKAAPVIVAAGAGVGSKENMALVEELARVLGGEVGATRAAVDAGWATLDRQIGQTGETVRPDLYVACGISGAVQHRVGMQDSRRIVAINTDPSAPIFRFSHYGVVGDVTEVIPKLIELWQS